MKAPFLGANLTTHEGKDFLVFSRAAGFANADAAASFYVEMAMLLPLPSVLVWQTEDGFELFGKEPYKTAVRQLPPPAIQWVQMRVGG